MNCEQCLPVFVFYFIHLFVPQGHLSFYLKVYKMHGYVFCYCFIGEDVETLNFRSCVDKCSTDI